MECSIWRTPVIISLSFPGFYAILHLLQLSVHQLLPPLVTADSSISYIVERRLVWWPGMATGASVGMKFAGTLGMFLEVASEASVSRAQRACHERSE